MIILTSTFAVITSTTLTMLR